MYNTVFLQDLEKAVKVLTEKIPNFSTFSSIMGNCEGNFVVKRNDETFIIKTKDWTVWQLKNSWRNPEWVELK